jgi:hypothetical protein
MTTFPPFNDRSHDADRASTHPEAGIKKQKMLYKINRAEALTEAQITSVTHGSSLTFFRQNANGNAQASATRPHHQGAVERMHATVPQVKSTTR